MTENGPAPENGTAGEIQKNGPAPSNIGYDDAMISCITCGCLVRRLTHYQEHQYAVSILREHWFKSGEYWAGTEFEEDCDCGSGYSKLNCPHQ